VFKQQEEAGDLPIDPTRQSIMLRITIETACSESAVPSSITFRNLSACLFLSIAFL
jgi:hypothetical protein